jgi:hypothetical protein
MRDVERAWSIWLAHQRRTVPYSPCESGRCEPTARVWPKRFTDVGLAGLRNRRLGSRPSTHRREQLRQKAAPAPTAFGCTGSAFWFVAARSACRVSARCARGIRSKAEGNKRADEAGENRGSMVQFRAVLPEHRRITCGRSDRRTPTLSTNMTLVQLAQSDRSGPGATAPAPGSASQATRLPTVSTVSEQFFASQLDLLSPADSQLPGWGTSFAEIGSHLPYPCLQGER